MTEGGGTMAMFVLRLAGLLSLEKVLNGSHLTTPSIFTNLSSTNESGSLIHYDASTDYKFDSDILKEPILEYASTTTPSNIQTFNQILHGKPDQGSRNFIATDRKFKIDHEYHDEDGVEEEFLLNLGQPPTDKDKSRNIKRWNVVGTTTTSKMDLTTKVNPKVMKNVNSSLLLNRLMNGNNKSFELNSKQNFPLPIAQDLDKNYIGKKKNSDLKDFQSYEAQSIEFSDYEFINGSTVYTPPPLSSRSLIIPLPKKGKRKNRKKVIDSSVVIAQNLTSQNNETKNKNDSIELKEEKDKNMHEIIQVTENNKLKIVTTTIQSAQSGPEEVNKTTSSDKQKLPTVNKNLNTRNNPYPYGPMHIPELNTKNHSVSVGNIFIDQKLENHQELLENHENFEENFTVKTDKPPVLFHFDKPGYSPKIPDSSIPPTRAPTPSDPWDCSPRCPSYKLLDWNLDYDVRLYPITTWVSTVIIANNRILAELEGYMKVQDYFYGLNDRGQLLNLTVPFVTQIKYGRHPEVIDEVLDFSVSLYVNHIDDPLNYDLPTPISNEVLIDRLESKTVFVSGFEANVWEVTETFLKEKAALLMEKLRHNGEAFLDRYIYLASYSRPELYHPVYYELWIYATTFRASAHFETPSLAPRRRPPPNSITIKSMNRLCRGVECPPFEVLRTYRYGIQKRRYFDGLFATTVPGVCEFSTLSVWKGFMPLHLYKHGINSHMEVIEATRPIALVHVKENSTETAECPQNLTMAIYLPKRLHSNPPLSGYDAPLVALNAMQDVVVYAYTVGGYLLDPHRVRKELSDLKYRLTEFGACFKDDEYYVVVYDFIVRYHGRQNEIWVVAENCKATKNG